MNPHPATSIQNILRAGGFATIPPQIAARWMTRNIPATLLCFPSCIRYVSVRRGLTSDVRRTFVATYYPIIDSARFADDSVQLSYGWLYASPFSVHILRETKSSLWHVYKCHGRKLLSYVVGDGYGDAMIRATSIGLADREPAFTFETNLATFNQIRAENLAQIALAEGSKSDADEFGLHNVVGARIKIALSPSKPILVFGQIQKPGEAALIFIPQSDAFRLAAIHDAIATSETWGEFLDAIPSDELARVLDRLKDDDGSVPDRSSKFDSELLGCGDGEYPDFVEQRMFDWLPAHVCRQFGKMESSVLNGPLLVLDVRRTPEIIAALECAGFECRLDEGLVRQACGN